MKRQSGCSGDVGRGIYIICATGLSFRARSRASTKCKQNTVGGSSVHRLYCLFHTVEIRRYSLTLRHAVVPWNRRREICTTVQLGRVHRSVYLWMMTYLWALRSLLTHALRCRPSEHRACRVRHQVPETESYFNRRLNRQIFGRGVPFGYR
jgi:hypothetical protein